MRYFKLVVAGLVAVLSYSLHAQILTGKSASNRISNAEMVRFTEKSAAPDYIRLMPGKEIPLEKSMSWMFDVFGFTDNDKLVPMKSDKDKIGFTHQKFTQTYANIPVEHGTIIVHSKNNKISSVNGLFVQGLQTETTPSISEEQALQFALDHIGAQVYMWQIPGAEEQLKSVFPNQTYTPKASLVLVSADASYTPASFRLAYKFDIYAASPLSRQYMYVDAANGNILAKNDRIHHSDVSATAETRYSGTRTMVTDSLSSTSFRLRETGRGQGIETYNLEQGTNTAQAVDFTDSDNYWNNVNAAQDEVATDAHWGAEMTYDYFYNVHNRNSIDNNGFKLVSYVHYDVAYNNAFWNGTEMTYGDGDGSLFNPLTCLDVTGHEIAHGLTEYTAGLIYSYESGALNESFSDIFGTAIDFYYRPTYANWLIGDEMTVSGNGIRSMSNPNAFGDPDTYLGTNWYTGSNDNGGVHTNSGVQNHWFYILSDGASGTNDLGNSYSVTGLGTTSAGEIAFRNLTVYLTSSSQHADARFYAIQSAADLFGACTAEVIATTDAWYAVGVGPAFTMGVTADFSVDQNTGCQVPFTVQFSNLTMNGGTYHWDFGDNTTSTLNNPSHTYTTFGTFDVTLEADGGACGADTTIQVSYINIDTANPCIVVLSTTSNQTQTACNGYLYDTGGPGGNYQDNTTATITISPIGASNVTLNFSQFAFESGYDYLYIYDGPNTSSSLIGAYDGFTLPNGGSITSTGSSITIQQTSDFGVTELGFELEWVCTLSTVPPVTNFSASTTSTCSGIVDFSDLSTAGPTSWHWDFGDNTTSTSQNPSHTYTSNGTYTVVLIASNSYGTDTLTLTNYITVNLPAAPTVTGDQICVGNTASVSANGSGTIYWYPSANSQNPLYIGNPYQTPILSSTTTYYAEDRVPGAIAIGGPADNTFGGGGNFTNDVRYLIFDVMQPCTLKTVKVYAQGAGNRTIEHRDAAGNVINSVTINIPTGTQVITLDFPLSPGTDYQLGISGDVDLYRNNNSASFPYTISNLAEITGTNAGQPGFYYFYYDWNLQEADCISSRTAVNATVDQVTANYSFTVNQGTVDFTDMSSGASAWFWNFGDSNTDTQQNPSHTYTASGVYTVMLIATSANGICYDTIYQVVNVVISSINPMSQLQGLEIYPNPVSNTLFFKNATGINFSVQITDVTGRVVFAATPTLNGQDTAIELPGSIAEGTYFLVCKNESGSVVKKLMVVK
jgi:Zn-dependent metalloprotease